MGCESRKEARSTLRFSLSNRKDRKGHLGAWGMVRSANTDIASVTCLLYIHPSGGIQQAVIQV